MIQQKSKLVKFGNAIANLSLTLVSLILPFILFNLEQNSQPKNIFHVVDSILLSLSIYACIIVLVISLVSFFVGISMLYSDWTEHPESDDKLSVFLNHSDTVPQNVKVLFLFQGLLYIFACLFLAQLKIQNPINYFLILWCALATIFSFCIGLFYEVKTHKKITTYFNVFNPIVGTVVSPLFLYSLFASSNKKDTTNTFYE